MSQNQNHHELRSGSLYVMKQIPIPQNHYKVLSLPKVSESGHVPTLEVIKRAYHRALLIYHPDKSHPATLSRPKYTIDQITQAYQVLSDPVSRSSFDQSLRLNPKFSSLARGATVSILTGETVDLDDLIYDDEQKLWYRACRCGQERGFVVTEDDLEKQKAEGEALVGCLGCSLWTKILFTAQDEG